MPCTDGGAPVTILRLLGLVKLGTTQSAISAVPVAKVRASQGITPAATAWAMYSGSQPSTHTTTVGAWGS